jgi:hypothetical protein
MLIDVLKFVGIGLGIVIAVGVVLLWWMGEELARTVE